MKKIGVLALQGDFLEHESALKEFWLNHFFCVIE